MGTKRQQDRGWRRYRRPIQIYRCQGRRGGEEGVKGGVKTKEEGDTRGQLKYTGVKGEGGGEEGDKGGV